MKKLTFGALALTVAIDGTVMVATSCGATKTHKKEIKPTSEGGKENIPHKKKTGGNKTYTWDELIKKIRADKYAAKIIKASAPGAIASAKGKYTNKVYPSTYTGTVRSHDIQLTSKEADKMVKDAIANGEELYLASTRGLKETPGKVVKAYVKTVVSKTKGKTYHIQYYLVKIKKQMTQEQKAKAQIKKTGIAVVIDKHGNKVIHPDSKVDAVLKYFKEQNLKLAKELNILTTSSLNIYTAVK